LHLLCTNQFNWWTQETVQSHVLPFHPRSGDIAFGGSCSFFEDDEAATGFLDRESYQSFMSGRFVPGDT
jgi:hypothetical protein